MARRGPKDDLTPTQRFDLFLWRADELRTERAVQEGHFNIELSLKFEAGGPLQARSREPDEALFRSFLLTFRMFVSNDEPVYINTVHNVIWTEIRSDPLRELMSDAQRKWRQSCKVGALQVVTNDGPIQPAELLDLWINGRYFHNDRRKEEAVQRLEAIGLPFPRHAFLNHVIDATNYIFFLAQTIAVARRQSLLD